MSPKELSVQLRAFNVALYKALRKEMGQARSYSMTELETLVYLFQNGRLFPTELATIARISTPSMSQILKKMEAEGVIERTPSATDKRKVVISLTLLGRGIVENVRYSKDEYLKNLIETKLTAKERALLQEALPVLAKLID